MSQSSNTIAICFISKSDDEQNKCTLTSENIYFICKGKEYVFELSQITKIEFKQKKLLFPLVIGGIIGSLFMIAGFNFLINIWWSLIVGLTGVLLFYYGWVGSQTITIHTKIKEYDVFIDQVTPPLEVFVSMVNESFIFGKSENIQYYFSLSKEDWQKASSIGFITPPSSGLRLLTDENFSKEGVLISINRIEIPNRINYLMDKKSDTMVPYVFEPISIDHIYIVSKKMN